MRRSEVSILALTVMEILFVFLLGFNLMKKQKDWNGWQDGCLLE